MHDLAVVTILSLVEGVTEFLPVSSTGHLIIAGHLLGYTGQKASCFEVFIQLGAILAVVMLYFERFWELIPWVEASEASEAKHGLRGLRGIGLLLLTTAPALVAGYFAHSTIKAHLFNPESVALALGVGGIAILVVERVSPRSEIHSVHDMTWKHALVVGLFQCLSLWPGVSRAAATILGGLLTKLDRQTAAEYSFLAAVPVMTAATAYDLMKNWNVLTIDDIWFFGLGFVLSFISAAVTVKLFISLLQRWSFEPFGWYRVLIAPLVYYLWK